MKRILFAFALVALVVPAIPRANGAEVSIDLFYNNLSAGNWIEVGDYGYGWQPDVAVSNSDWRPYSDGYWAYTDYGWTWVSYEDFGWATYHYGRWARFADYGWVWFPGSDLDWGPAWVSWRTGGDRVGWAPLPPRGPGIVYEGRPISGHVDIEFDIGPAYYNFVDVRYIGAPVLRSYIYPTSQNVTYVSETVNVTNITVKNKTVYNYGPDYNVLSQHSERPIQRLRVERESNVDFATAVKSGGLTKVQGDRLMVAAPQRIQKPTKQVAPPAVKTKLSKDKVKIEKGWSVAGDEKAQAELKKKFRSEDSRKVPPPTGGKAAGAAAAAGGSPPAMESPAGSPATATGAGILPAEKGKKGKLGKRGQPGQVDLPAGQASPAAAEHGKHKGKPGVEEQAATGMTPPTGQSAAAHGRGEHKGKKKANMPPNSPPTEMERNASGGGKHKDKQRKDRPESTFTPSSSAHGGENVQKEQHGGPPERGQMGAASEQPAPVSGGQGKPKGHQVENVPSMPEGAPNRPSHGGKQKAQEVQPPPQADGAPGAERVHGKAEGGKKKKGEKESPSPQ